MKTSYLSRIHENLGFFQIVAACIGGCTSTGTYQQRDQKKRGQVQRCQAHIGDRRDLLLIIIFQMEPNLMYLSSSLKSDLID